MIVNVTPGQPAVVLIKPETDYSREIPAARAPAEITTVPVTTALSVEAVLDGVTWRLSLSTEGRFDKATALQVLRQIARGMEGRATW